MGGGQPDNGNVPVMSPQEEPPGQVAGMTHSLLSPSADERKQTSRGAAVWTQVPQPEDGDRTVCNIPSPTRPRQGISALRPGLSEEIH